MGGATAERPTAKVVAFLQNQWFQNADRAREIMARHTDPYTRARLSAFYLFRQNHTGRVLRAIFGVERCRQIVWENASPQIGDFASARFPADPVHIRGVLTHFRPKVVLGFGRVACDALEAILEPGRGILGPHPAARTVGHGERLHWMARQLELELRKHNG